MYALKGKLREIPEELFSDAIALSLFYISCAFTNKVARNIGSGKKDKLVPLKNYIMPFSAKQLSNACTHNMLNVLYPDKAEIIDRDGMFKDFKSGVKKIFCLSAKVKLL